MSYAKVIYPYQTGVIGDLELQVDDIIEVIWKRKKICMWLFEEIIIRRETPENSKGNSSIYRIGLWNHIIK
jgi:hypothetical protein